MIGMRHYTTQRGKTQNYKLVAHKKKQQCQFSKRVGSDSSSLCNESVLKFMHHHLEDAKINQGQVNAKRGVI